MKRTIALVLALTLCVLPCGAGATTLPVGKGVLVNDGTTSGAASTIRWPNGTISSLVNGVATIDLASLGGGDMSAATWAPSGFLALTYGTTAAAQRTVLGVAIGTNVQAWDADLDTYAGITPSANVQTLLGAADYSAMRTQLGLVIGTNVQAYNANLTTYAGIAPSANIQSLLGAADYSTARTLLGLAIGTNVQAYDADLTTYAGITPSANVQSLLGAANYGAMRTLLSLVPGTDVQAYDAELAALAGLTSAADALPYFTGSGTAAVTTLSSFGRSLIDDADASAARTTLGLAIGTNVQAYDADLTTYAGITPSANMQTFLGSADFAAMRTNLGLVIGTNVQAYDADLTTYAGITPSADIQTFLGYSNFAAIKAGLSIDDLVTLSGVADGATNLGTFTGSTITDGSATIKSALQQLETAVESVGGGHSPVTLAASADALLGLTGQELSLDTATAHYVLAGPTSGGAAAPTMRALIASDFPDLSSVYQPYDADLTTYAGITPSANIQTFLGAADYAAMRTQLGLTIGTNVQAYDADLTTYAGITPSANVQSFLAAADYSAMRILLGLVIGTNVQAYDADLTTYAGITPSANVQTFLGAADYAAMRTQLSLVVGTNVQAYDAELAALAGLTSAANALPYFTGSGTAAVTTMTAFGRSLIDDADASAARTTLGLAIGTDVQAYDADLTTWAGVSSSANGRSLVSAADYAAMRTLLGVTTAASPTFSGTITLGTLTGVLRADTGVVSVDSDVTDLVSASSTTLAGKIEIATNAETTTGTDTARAVTPDDLAYLFARPFAIGGTTPAAGTFTTLTAGTGGVFSVSLAGVVTAVGFDLTKVSGSPGRLTMYEANSTDTDYAGWEGPASLSANTSYLLKLGNSRPTSDNSVIAFAGSSPTGTGTPADPYIFQGSVVDLDNYLLLAGGTLTGKLNTVAPSTASSINIGTGASLPSSPVNGDLFIKTGTGAGMYAYNAGSWVGPFGTSTANVAGGSTSGTGEIAAYGDTSGKLIGRSYVAFSGPGTSVKTKTISNANDTIAELGQTNTYTALNSFTAGLATGNGATGPGFIRFLEDSDNGTDYSTITGGADAGTYPSFVFSGSQGSEDMTLVAASNLWTFASTSGATFAFTPSVAFSAGLTVPTGQSVALAGTSYVAFGADPGDSGAVRLSNNTALSWEQSTPGTDIFIALDSSDILQVGQNAAQINLGTSGTGNVTVTGDLTVTGNDILIPNATAGARLTGGNGLLTIKGEGDGTDEDLTVNLNSANVATVSSTTGVADVNFSAINVRSSGYVTGMMPPVVLTIASGVHDGSNDQAIMTDSGESFTTSQFVGMTLYNITDGSSCTVTANNATTITCTLAGGTQNDWDTNDVWQVGPGPYQAGSWFYVVGASTIRHPATVGYVACYESDAAAVLTVDMASASMIFQGTLDSAVVALDAGDSIDSSGSTTGDFMCIHNKSATEAQGKGKRGTWVDGGAS